MHNSPKRQTMASSNSSLAPIHLAVYSLPFSCFQKYLYFDELASFVLRLPFYTHTPTEFLSDISSCLFFVIPFRTHARICHSLLHLHTVRSLLSALPFNNFMPNYVRWTDWTAINQMECKERAHLDKQIFVIYSVPFEANTDAATIIHITDYDENNEGDCQINVVVYCKFGNGIGDDRLGRSSTCRWGICSHGRRTNGQPKVLKNVQRHKIGLRARLSKRNYLFLLLYLNDWCWMRCWWMEA